MGAAWFTNVFKASKTKFIWQYFLNILTMGEGFGKKKKSFK